MGRRLADVSRLPIGRHRPRQVRGSPHERPAAPAPNVISLWIDDYDDIFSDFDPRAFSERALSEDFLAELKRAVRDRRDGVSELRFLVPAPVRDLSDEATLRKRLREHFRKHAERLGRVHRRTLWTSVAVAAAGFGVLTASAVLRGQPEAFWRTLLNVVLEPSGWFAVWFGLDRLVYGARHTRRKRAFYRRMATADVGFIAYVDDGGSRQLGARAGRVGGGGHLG
jgi:hypothetical protein